MEPLIRRPRAALSFFYKLPVCQRPGPAFQAGPGSPVHVTGRRGALFVFLKGVNKYGIKIYLPRLWDPFGL